LGEGGVEPTANGPDGEPPFRQDHEPVPYEEARDILMYGLPEVATLGQASEMARDKEIERLVKIGRYMVDRWSAQRAVGPGPWLVSSLEKRRQQALDNCSFMHFKALQLEAQTVLKEYLDRKRPNLDGDFVKGHIDTVGERIKNEILKALPVQKVHKRPEFVRWLLTEFGAGPIAALGVIFTAVVIQLTVPKFVEAARIEFVKIFGVESPQTKTNPPPQQTQMKHIPAPKAPS